jgi:HEAT repeat protein
MIRLGNHRLNHTIIAATAVLALMIAGLAQATPVDPVESLRQALRLAVRDSSKNPEELTFRRANLQKKLDGIKTIGEMRRALILQEWRDEDRDDKVVEIDRPLRVELAKRFETALNRALKDVDLDTKIAAINVIGEMGLGGRGVVTKLGAASGLASSLAALARDPSNAVQQEAAEAIGRIFPDPGIAVPMLSELLTHDDVNVRRSAAEGLASLVRTSSQLARGRSTTGVEATRADVLATTSAVVPAAGRGLADQDALVRRNCADALQLTAQTLSELVADPRPSSDFPPPGRAWSADERADVVEYRRQVQEEQQEILPVARRLKAEASALAAVAADASPGIRITARRALEDMADARLRLLRRALSVPTVPKEKEGALRIQPAFPARPGVLVARRADEPAAISTDDPLLQALEIAMPELIAGLRDPNPRARLVAIDVFEVLGDRSAPAGPSIVAALRDSDRYVRWSAVRTLGRMAPLEAEAAVPELARLLFDPDLDLALAAALALDRYDELAAPAVPALIGVLKQRDVELRIAALTTLISIGDAAAPAIPDIAQVLGSHIDPRVRRAAADALGKFGPLAKGTEPILLKATNDDDPDVRRLAADALLATRRQK